ncbi:MAG TPA: hypothetical protein VJB66_02160 [Candidatus Nanoarchaeia archaeon]|nr:hypothetical protein [Candidatus Nanoarchaeia archaeon]
MKDEGRVIIYHTHEGDFAINESGCILIPPQYPIAPNNRQDFVLARIVESEVMKGEKRITVRTAEITDVLAVGENIAPVPKPKTQGYMNDYQPAQYTRIDKITMLSYESFMEAMRNLEENRKQYLRSVDAVRKEIDREMEQLQKRKRDLMIRPAPSLSDILNESS